jgi:hypothetical protein
MARPKRTQWYVQFSEGDEVPVTSQDLRELAKAGVIHPHTQVRKEGMAEAVSARKVRGLFQQSPEGEPAESRTIADTQHSTSRFPEDNVGRNANGDKDIKASEGTGSWESFFSMAEEATLDEDFETALKNYSIFIENELSNKELLNIAHTNRGLIFIHLGSIEEARHDLLRAMELGSDKARQIYDEFFERARSTTVVHQDDPENSRGAHSAKTISAEPANGRSANALCKSLWILFVGVAVNLIAYVASPFGKGVGLQALVRQSITVLAITAASYGIVTFFGWLARLLIKQNLQPVHRAIICSIVCTLMILGAILEYHLHGK